MQETSNSERMSRRQRIKLEREARILRAAASVFAERGYHNSTIREIAESADVADGTIYNYFESKFDLLVAIVEQVAEPERLSSELETTEFQDARQLIALAFRRRLARIDDRRDVLKAVLPQVLVDTELGMRFYDRYVLRVAQLLESYLEAEIGAGNLIEVDASLASRLVQSMFVGVLVLRILGDELLEARWGDVPDLFTTMIIDGLSSNKGKEPL